MMPYPSMGPADISFETNEEPNTETMSEENPEIVEEAEEVQLPIETLTGEVIVEQSRPTEPSEPVEEVN